MNPRSDRVKQLERSIHETFRGRYVNPYIFNIVPEVTGDADTFYAFSRSFKSGYVLGSAVATVYMAPRGLLEPQSK